MHSPGFDHHNKDHPKNKHDPVLEIVTGLPNSIEQYVDFTMISQAHYARRAFAPVIASFCEGADGELELRICNNSAAPVGCDAEVTLGRFSAAPDLVAAVTAEVGPAQTRLVWSRPRGEYSPTAENYAWVHSPSGAFAPNRFFFAEIKDVDFGSGRVESEVVRTSADRAVVRVRAAGFNYFVKGNSFNEIGCDLQRIDNVPSFQEFNGYVPGQSGWVARVQYEIGF